MLSICIPVYNYDVTPLAKKLINQCKTNSVLTEIVIMDDGSNDFFKKTNCLLKKYKEVKYIELKKNLGSAAIRNKLACEAKYKNVLFLDSDSDISSVFIKNYIPYLHGNYAIVYGGRIHPKELPSLDKSLRWKVGKKKEDHSAHKRSLIPNKSFMSNNFLTTKELFKDVCFDETIKRSGHEDTMFGIELEEKGIKIVHVENPVVHIGLESNLDFIKKTEQRLETLKYISHKYDYKSLIYKRITILKYNNFILKLGLNGLIKVLFKIFKSNMRQLLLSRNPSMLVYDLYKLGYYNSL